MFFATEINHIKELCENEDANSLVLSLISGKLDEYHPSKLAQCIMSSPNLEEQSMEALLNYCEENRIYASPQIKSVAMQRNKHLSPEFLLRQEKNNVYHAPINPNIPGDIAAKRAIDGGSNYYFLLRNKNVTSQNSQGIIDNDLNAAFYHASGYGISKEKYIDYMDAFFKLKDNPQTIIKQTSATTLFSSPYLKDYLNHSGLNVPEFILKFDNPSTKTLCSIVDSESIKSNDITSLIIDKKIMQNASGVLSFLLESLQLSRYHLNPNDARDCLKAITKNITELNLNDISNVFGLHTYLILLNIDYGNYDDELFYQWAKQLNNETSLKQNIFTPEKEYGVITSSGDKTESLIMSVNKLDAKNNLIDIILEFSSKHYPVLTNNLTSHSLNKKIEMNVTNIKQDNIKLTRFL